MTCASEVCFDAMVMYAVNMLPFVDIIDNQSMNL